MASKRKVAVLIGIVFVACSIMTSCWSTGTARKSIPKTAVTLQRVRSPIMADLLMEIFIDDVPQELSNGATIADVVNNGEHIIYAVMGKSESKSIRFTATSESLTINVKPRYNLLDIFGDGDGVELTIEVK